ncbi:MAG: hypothetical protein K6C12_03285 [Oscillospiraceae bacterium]|nr:hypothetical protein [Oscillospiraceae bacterium]
MVTANKRYQYFNGELLMICEVFCLSTDDKPTAGIPNGASLTEIDTGNFYLFDGDISTWVLQFCMQG